VRRAHQSHSGLRRARSSVRLSVVPSASDQAGDASTGERDPSADHC